MGSTGDATKVSESKDTPLERVIRNTSTSFLQPYSFFVSWQGVITVAYSGFPPPLETLKSSITAVHQSLPRENPGAMWPKTSLGCLKENTRLSPEQLQTLISICKTHSQAFAAENDALKVCVDAASVVLYECRTLERCISVSSIPLGQPPDCRPPCAAQQQYVHKVVNEWNAPDYWFHASKDGNREKHYRGDAVGATLVYWLDKIKAMESQLIQNIQKFRMEVDEKLPGMYTWFEDSSLHVTLRNLKD